MATCTKLQLGDGKTPEHPCTRIGIDPFSVELCTVWDFANVRSIAVIENNILVARLNRFNELVGDGKAKWEDRTNVAWEISLTAWNLFQRYPAGYFGAWSQLTSSDMPDGPRAVVTAFAQMAKHLHDASCNVAAALEEAGDTVFEPGPAPTEPMTIEERAVNFVKAAATGAGYVAGAAVLLALGYAAVKKLGGR